MAPYCEGGDWRVRCKASGYRIPIATRTPRVCQCRINGGEGRHRPSEAGSNDSTDAAIIAFLPFLPEAELSFAKAGPLYPLPNRQTDKPLVSTRERPPLCVEDDQQRQRTSEMNQRDVGAEEQTDERTAAAGRTMSNGLRRSLFHSLQLHPSSRPPLPRRARPTAVCAPWCTHARTRPRASEDGTGWKGGRGGGKRSFEAAFDAR